MSKRRMLTQRIIESDPFLEMPLSAQVLYFHLIVHADDVRKPVSRDIQ